MSILLQCSVCGIQVHCSDFSSLDDDEIKAYVERGITIYGERLKGIGIEINEDDTVDITYDLSRCPTEKRVPRIITKRR